MRKKNVIGQILRKYSDAEIIGIGVFCVKPFIQRENTVGLGGKNRVACRFEMKHI